MASLGGPDFRERLPRTRGSNPGRALGISGVKASVSAWQHPEAQIDMLSDRADDIVSLVEIKFTDAPFESTRA